MLTQNCCPERKRGNLYQSILLAIVATLFVTPNCFAQKKSDAWTKDNIQEWIGSTQQKRAKRKFVNSLQAKDRKQFNHENWFLPPQMYVDSSQKGQLGRLVFPAYKVMEVVDDERVLIKVTDEKGKRYLIVFDIGDTSQIRKDNRAHISPDIYKVVLFERVNNLQFRNAQNVRQSLPMFKKLDPAEVMQSARTNTNSSGD